MLFSPLARDGLQVAPEICDKIPRPPSFRYEVKSLNQGFGELVFLLTCQYVGDDPVSDVDVRAITLIDVKFLVARIGAVK